MSAITGIGDSTTIVRSASMSSSRGTATRTMSAPASATVRIWSMVAWRLAVSVFVIVWTATGAPPPMGTPPTLICRAEAMSPVYESPVVADDAGVNKRRSSQALSPACGDTLHGVVSPALLADLRRACGEDGVVTGEAQRRTYESDGLLQYAVTPGVVVLPATAEQVQAVVRACHAAGVPFVARGAGTGLSGGALPVEDGVVIGLARMNRILGVDLESERIVVQPGVTNLQVTEAVIGAGYYYAPDPSSQQVCTIGGNLAENSGGAHCLKYGFTANHVTGLVAVLPDGEVVRLGGVARESPGPDLLGAFVGSEGTLGIATEITLRVLRRPESLRTVLAAFDSMDGAG